MTHKFKRLVIVVAMMVTGFVGIGWAAETEVDPSSVSEGLKAIFRYGNGSRDTSNRLNANTVALMSGTIGGTYVQIGADLESVLDDGENLRVLSIVGRGSVQSVADILYLKGVDLGIVRSDTLDYLEKKGFAKNIKGQFTYITKLYNEEVHVVAPKSVHSLADLEGKKVSIDLPNGGTFVTAIAVFERLGIHPNFAYIEQRIAYDKLAKGELDAVIAVQGQPSKATTQIKDPNLHLVPIDYAKSLQSDYLPAQLTSDNYPNLIPKGELVDTIAVPAVLAAFNWAPNTERYRRLARFVDAFFSKIGELQQPPFHPKWREVSLDASLPGWVRFRPAQEWLDRNGNTTAASDIHKKFEQFLTQNQARLLGPIRSEDREALFHQFLEWQKTHPVVR
ncbi:MAG: TRAP transporter substrate-binding protein [Hyphomicrobiales bacterium]|nr:TRAP transporter substrate-binding protein [Hyphomicrobiales bacterium]